MTTQLHLTYQDARSAITDLLFISANAALGYGLGPMILAINPIHGAVFMAMDVISFKLLYPISELGIHQFQSQNQTINLAAKIISFAISFFASAFLSTLILGALGVTITLGAALSLSLLAVAIWVSLYAGLALIS